MEKVTQNKLHGLVLELLRVGMPITEVIDLLSVEQNRLKESAEYLQAIRDSDFRL